MSKSKNSHNHGWPKNFRCIECQSTRIVKVSGKEIYPHRSDLYHLAIWQCEDCKARVGSHDATGIPLGYPCHKPTMRMRDKVHSLLDPIWKSTPKHHWKDNRKRCYEYLSFVLDLPLEDTHVGMMSFGQCQRAETALESLEGSMANLKAALRGMKRMSHE